MLFIFEKMSLKFGVVFVALVVGSIALPLQKEKDMSIFFGHKDPSGRIVGGTVAGSVPYMVAVTAGFIIRGLMCGGSLITQRHVLTAAHCIDPFYGANGLAMSLRAIVGTNRWNTGGAIYSFAGNISHSEYDADNVKNDIGFLITSTEVELSDRVALTSINYGHIVGGVGTTVTGWGKIANNGATSEVLLQLKATVVDSSICETEIAEKKVTLDMPYAPDLDPTTEICVFHSATEGMCHGDSGSPLMHTALNQQIGIVSWGLPCARGAPDVFARLSAYRPWIEQSIVTVPHSGANER